MRETTDLGETILTVASELFAEHGYVSTSMKQIAKAAGCTNAALYYYFEDGKAHILREVIRTLAQDTEFTITAPTADALQNTFSCHRSLVKATLGFILDIH